MLGGGLFAYKHHKEKQEHSQGEGWASSNWLSEAEARTAAFHQQGPQGPYTWVRTPSFGFGLNLGGGG